MARRPRALALAQRTASSLTLTTRDTSNVWAPLKKVLMDGVSSINILYYDTFKRMKLRDRQLIPTETVFHGIVPGKSAKPIGKIYLEVALAQWKIIVQKLCLSR